MEGTTNDKAKAVTPERAEVGRILREARTKSGLKIRAAARLAGVSDQLWGQAEKGWKQLAPGVYATASTKPENLAAMAAVVGLDPSELLAPLGWTEFGARALAAYEAGETQSETVGASGDDPGFVTRRQPAGVEDLVDVGSLTDEQLARLLADAATENARRRAEQ